MSISTNNRLSRLQGPVGVVSTNNQVSATLNPNSQTNQKNQSTITGDMLSLTGLNLYLRGEHGGALQSFQDAHRHYQRAESLGKQASNLINLGNVTQAQGNLNVALKYFQQAQTILNRPDQSSIEAVSVRMNNQTIENL